MKTLTLTEQQIRIHLLLANLSQKAIAKELHVSDAAVSQVITGVRTSPRIRKGIAKALGKPMEQFWPPTEHTNSNSSKVNNHSTKLNNKKQERKIRS